MKPQKTDIAFVHFSFIDGRNIFALDESGRIWHYCQRITGKLNWTLTEFAEPRRFQFKQPITKEKDTPE